MLLMSMTIGAALQRATARRPRAVSTRSTSGVSGSIVMTTVPARATSAGDAAGAVAGLDARRSRPRLRLCDDQANPP